MALSAGTRIGWTTGNLETGYVQQSYTDLAVAGVFPLSPDDAGKWKLNSVTGNVTLNFVDPRNADRVAVMLGTSGAAPGSTITFNSHINPGAVANPYTMTPAKDTLCLFQNINGTYFLTSVLLF